jgi:hypothetical protein
MGIQNRCNEDSMKVENSNTKIGIPSPIPLQIRIGVTGHRNINLTDELKRSIHTTFTVHVQKIINPRNRKLITPISYKVVTPLADGADRIVAIEAMDILNAKMEVVLPMMKEEYKETFLNDASREEFDNLLLKAEHIEPLITQKLTDHFPDKEFSECKHIAYKNVGSAVLYNCDILIALWDGTTNNKKGGTAEVVNEALVQRKTVIRISSEAPHRIKIIHGDDFIRRSFESLELYNSFAITAEEKITYEQNMGKRLFDEFSNRLNSANMNLVQEKLIPHYVRASRLAKSFQPIYKKTGLTVYILSPLAVAAVALGVIFQHMSALFFLTELILLLAIVALILFEDRGKVHDKWIQNRFLAEQLRSAMYFVSCGFKPRQIEISSHLRVAHRPDDWMIKVYDRILQCIPTIPNYQENEYSLLREYIQLNWLQDQINYHEDNMRKHHRYSRHLELSGWSVFGLAVLAALAHLIIVYTDFEFQGEWISEWITFFAIILPAVGASIGAIRTHGEYPRIAKRSERMAVALSGLMHESEEVKSMSDLEKLLDKIEETMLHETQDWLMLMKFVKLEAI